jgi:hypothetical protein
MIQGLIANLNQDILPMSTTIPAVLDLDKAIASFRESMIEAMTLDELSSWDGNALRQREQRIRQASLVLAGQCIALLLHVLVSHPQVHQEASSRTAGLRRPGSVGMGTQTVTVVTVGNVLLSLRIPYIQGKRSTRGKKERQPGQRGKASEGSFYPFLAWLGMMERVTPLVWTTVAHQGMLSTSFAVARAHLIEWGIRLSEGRIQKLVYRLGAAGEALRQDKIEQLHRGELPTGEWLRGKRVVISADGGRIRVRRQKRGKARKHGRHGYRGPWKEPKLLTIYCVDENGQRLQSLEVPITHDGTLDAVEGFMEIVEMHLVRLGLVHAEQILLVADGADWIWNRFPALLKKLAVPIEKVVELIDFYHASEHLYAFAEGVFSSKKAAKAWAKRACSQLKRGQITTLIDQMQKRAQQPKSRKKRESAQKKLAYFTQQLQRFEYQRVQNLQLPIGSGAIESLIRQVVNLRIKGTGKFWLKHHAELILMGRCQWAAGAWEQFCVDILLAKVNPSPLTSIDELYPTQAVAA